MDAKRFAGLIDSTLLRADAAEKEIEDLATGAALWGFAAVCVPPCHVGLAARVLKGTEVRVATVAGFPLGFQAAGVKLIEALKAFAEGASEIDMVMNISRFKSGCYEAVADETGSIVKALPDAVIKVIIEAALLTDDEKAVACGIAAASGAHFVKTSTGFGPGGATAKDVSLLRRVAAGRIKVKASGGIKDLEGALAMVEAGAQRLGTSSAARIMEELAARKS